MSVHGGGWVSQRRGMRRQVAATGSDSRYQWLQTSPASPQPLGGPVLYQDPEITQALRGLFHSLCVFFFLHFDIILQLICTFRLVSTHSRTPGKHLLTSLAGLGGSFQLACNHPTSTSQTVNLTLLPL